MPIQRSFWASSSKLEAETRSRSATEMLQGLDALMETLAKGDAADVGFYTQHDYVVDYLQRNGLSDLKQLARKYPEDADQPNILVGAFAEARLSSASRRALGFKTSAKKLADASSVHTSHLEGLWRDVCRGARLDRDPQDLMECRRALFLSRQCFSGADIAFDPRHQRLLLTFVRLAANQTDEAAAVAHAYLKLARGGVSLKDAWRPMAAALQLLLQPAVFGAKRDPVSTLALGCRLWAIIFPLLEKAPLMLPVARNLVDLCVRLRGLHQEFIILLAARYPELAEPACFAPQADITADRQDSIAGTEPRNTRAVARPPLGLSHASLQGLEGVPRSVHDLWNEIERAASHLNNGEIIRSKARTLLLHGAPGTRKRTLAHALGMQVQAANLLFFELGLGDIVSRFFGGSAGNSRSFFQDIEAQAVARRQPVLLFMKDVDQLLGRRQQDSGERNSITNALLEFINPDGAGPCKHVFIVATTSRRDLMDGAACSRFAQQTLCSAPDAELRAQAMMGAAIEPDQARALAWYGEGLSLRQIRSACEDARRGPGTYYPASLFGQLTQRLPREPTTVAYIKGPDGPEARIDVVLHDVAARLAVVPRGEALGVTFAGDGRIWRLGIDSASSHVDKNNVRLQVCEGRELQDGAAIKLTLRYADGELSEVTQASGAGLGRGQASFTAARLGLSYEQLAQYAANPGVGIELGLRLTVPALPSSLRAAVTHVEGEAFFAALLAMSP